MGIWLPPGEPGIFDSRQTYCSQHPPRAARVLAVGSSQLVRRLVEVNERFDSRTVA